MKQKLQVGKFNIGWMSENFKQVFGDVKVSPKKCNLIVKVLKKPMTDKQILSDWKPENVTLDEVLWTLNHKEGLKGEYNIFYVKDSTEILWAVDAYWYGGARNLDANSVEYPFEWVAGSQVFSRKYSGLENSDSCNLDGEIIKIKGLKYKLTPIK